MQSAYDRAAGVPSGATAEARAVRPVDTAARPSVARGTMAPMTSTPSRLDPQIAARLKRSADGLLPAIAQQYDTGEVLMLGWMDDEALHRTLTTGRCTYWSRSRQEYWVKGDTSGHYQWVKSVALDCDADTVLVKVDQVGAACHTGARTCFDADVLLEDAGSGVSSPDQ
jgi:phosphoribosyl-AMP cyclohydrolase